MAAQSEQIRQNESLLDEVYFATQMGLDAVETILPQVKDASLREQFEQHRKDYRSLGLKAKAMLHESGEQPKKEKLSQKMMLKSSIKMKTLANHSTGHIAELMINGTTMGIIDLTKKMNNMSESDAGAKQLANDYISKEQKHIEILKQFLN